MDQVMAHTGEKSKTSKTIRTGRSWKGNDSHIIDKLETNDFKTKKNLSVDPHEKVSDTSGGNLPTVVQDVLQSPGKSLDHHTLPLMENYFGHNFRNVRVHDDPKSAESAKAVNAFAYTVGQDVVFADGAYDPHKNQGREVLVHELTHVVQQSSSPVRKEKLKIGETRSSFEREAENQAVQFINQAFKSRQHHITGLPAGYGILQRQVAGVPNLLTPLNTSSDEITIAEGESITAENPKLVQLAGAFRQKSLTEPGGFIKLYSYLSESSKLSSAQQTSESSHLQQRMVALRSALVKLGVSESNILIESATAFSTKAAGQIMGSVYHSAVANSLLLPTRPLFEGPVVPPAAASVTPSLSDMLSFHFKAGGFEFAAELPKSVSAKLPIHLSAAKTLSFELKAESSGDFSFSIGLNGSRHLNVSAKAGIKVDKDKGTSGSVGLEITTSKSVCNAPSPEALKATITAAGEKLMKAGKEWKAAKPDDKLSKLIDIAGAIGEMHDAVDKSKSACKGVPRATFNLGFQGPISPSDSFMNDPDPLKRPASFFGGSLTIPF